VYCNNVMCFAIIDAGLCPLYWKHQKNNHWRKDCYFQARTSEARQLYLCVNTRRICGGWARNVEQVAVYLPGILLNAMSG